MMSRYNSSDLSSYSVFGEMHADQGKVQSAYRGPDIDWFCKTKP